MATKDLVIYIGAKTDELHRELKKSEARVRAFGAALAVGGAAVTASLNEYRKYETALVGVGKTTGLAGDALKKYGEDIKNLSVKTGQSANDLLAISQAAGQLGVTGSDRLKVFTETIAKLGTASDLAGEEAATTLTRILNVTGEGVDNIDTFASVIVSLGNSFAASESEIARMAQEVSRATAVFGVSSAESAALGTALKSVGVQAELGGSVVGKTFRMIDEAIRNGGAEMQSLQVITGMTGEELKKTFAEDSTAVFQKFVEGLGQVKGEGGSVAAALEQFGLSGDEVNKVLPVLAERSELLGKALNQAGEEVKNATALNKEFEAQNDTLDNNLKKLEASIIAQATAFGEILAPAVSFAAKEMAEDINGVGTGINALADIFVNVGVIIAESLNFLIAKFEEFAAASLRSIGSTIEQAQNLADVLPFVENSFQGSIDAINAKAEQYEKSAQERQTRSNEFFAAGQEEKTNILAESLNAQNDIENENYESKQAIDEERHATELERDQERRDAKLELEGERHEEDVALDEERHAGNLERRLAQIAELQDAEDKAQKKAEKDKVAAERKLVSAKDARVRQEKELDQALVDSGFDALSQIVGDNKAATTALLVGRKAAAVAQAIMDGQAAAALAIATVLPPAGEAIAAQRIAMANINAGIIAATAIPEIAGTFAAQDGGVVPGAPMGDKPFGFLEGGEIIVPQRLAPTFEQMFGNFPSPNAPVSQGGGDINVMIGLNDDAAQILTIQQYEDSRIGVSR